MRLHRHDEIVEAMTARVYANIPDASALESQRAARNALDAMLEVVVKLGVGKNVWKDPAYEKLTNSQSYTIWEFPALILRMEARDDE